MTPSYPCSVCEHVTSYESHLRDHIADFHQHSTVGQTPDQQLARRGQQVGAKLCQFTKSKNKLCLGPVEKFTIIELRTRKHPLI